jgi:hypothetical protein
MADNGGRAGTWRDWPVWVIVGGWLGGMVLVALDVIPNWMALAVVLFGVVALLVRRGAFTARR